MMKIKVRLLRQQAVRFKIYKKSDITVIISMNENMQISKNSSANKR